MNNNIYLYYYKEELPIPRLLKEYDIKNVYVCNEYERYEVYVDKYSLAIILFYKLQRIICIECGKYKDILRLNVIDKLSKINILDKKVFNAIFNYGLSENLSKLVIDIDILGDDAEIVELKGNRLLNLDLLDEFDVKDVNSTTKLKSYSIQPYGYKYLITIKSINKLEFNKRFTLEDIDNIILKFVILLYKVEWSDKN